MYEYEPEPRAQLKAYPSGVNHIHMFVSMCCEISEFLTSLGVVSILGLLGFLCVVVRCSRFMVVYVY